MTAHHNSSASPETYANRDVKALKDTEPSHHQAALQKLHEDSQVMSSKGHAAEQKYWDTMKSKGGDSLPDLKFTKDGDHVSKVEGKDGKVLYDSHAIAKGEGPYQALRRSGLSHQEALDQAHKIKKESGRDSFKQNESAKVDANGSVVTRENNKNDSGYKETTSKDGNHKTREFDKDQKLTHETTVDKDGKRSDWKLNPDNTTTSVQQPDKDHRQETQRQANGDLISKTNDETKPDGTRSVVTTDKDGNKRTETYDKEKHQNSVVQENKDGTAAGWRKDAQGNMTTIDQPDANHRKETTNDAGGKFVSEANFTKDENGVTREVKDKNNNVNTDVWNAAGEQQSSIRTNADGSKIGWKKGADGKPITVEEAAPARAPQPAPPAPVPAAPTPQPAS